jgi:hypothetical protein
MRLLVRAKQQTAANRLTIEPSPFLVRHRPLRILDFDIENRPLSYLGSDFTTAEVTAIAWAWVGSPEVEVFLLGECDLPYILTRFAEAWREADLVTGHYVRGHDIPMLNGALMECRMPVLSDKLVQDTKLALPRSKGISLSQESLGAMLRLDHAKEQMNQSKWRAANRLTPEGLAEVRRRVVGDVKQHMALRQELLDLGYLGAPTMWRSGMAQAEAYVP